MKIKMFICVLVGICVLLLGCGEDENTIVPGLTIGTPALVKIEVVENELLGLFTVEYSAGTKGNVVYGQNTVFISDAVPPVSVTIKKDEAAFADMAADCGRRLGVGNMCPGARYKLTGRLYVNNKKVAEKSTSAGGKGSITLNASW